MHGSDACNVGLPWIPAARTLHVELLDDAHAVLSADVHQVLHLLHNGVSVGEVHGGQLEAQIHCDAVEAVTSCPAFRTPPDTASEGPAYTLRSVV